MNAVPRKSPFVNATLGGGGKIDGGGFLSINDVIDVIMTSSFLEDDYMPECYFSLASYSRALLNIILVRIVFAS